MDFINKLFGGPPGARTDVDAREVRMLILFSLPVCAAWAGINLKNYVVSWDLVDLAAALLWVAVAYIPVVRLLSHYQYLAKRHEQMAQEITERAAVVRASTVENASVNRQLAEQTLDFANTLMRLLLHNKRPYVLVLETNEIPSEELMHVSSSATGYPSHSSSFLSLHKTLQSHHPLEMRSLALTTQHPDGSIVRIALPVQHAMMFLSCTNYQAEQLDKAPFNKSGSEYWRFHLTNTDHYDPSWSEVAAHLLKETTDAESREDQSQ